MLLICIICNNYLQYDDKIYNVSRPIPKSEYRVSGKSTCVSSPLSIGVFMSRSVERGTRALIFISKQTGCGLLVPVSPAAAAVVSVRSDVGSELEIMDRGRGSLGHPGLGPATASGRGSRTGKISLRPAAAGHGHGHGHSIMVKFRRNRAWALEGESEPGPWKVTA